MKRSILFLCMLAGLLQAGVKSQFDIPNRAERVIQENQWRADQGDGTYRNPVLMGHWHDPSVVRVGEDYYMCHCEYESILIWHSRDLVNWRPIGRPIKTKYPSIWACDLIYHEGLFYLYCPIVLPERRNGERFSNFVTTAEDPAGPWSEPVDLYFGGIDPGHVVGRDGKRYIYVNNGRYVQLSDDGLSKVTELKQVYDGWEYPEEWIVQCKCLESPKLFFHNDYFYMVSAQGGTSGPSTSHMIVVARSKNATGPWENSPYNPMVRTYSRDEAWWTQGHGTILDAPDGSWWVIYHGYMNNLRVMGRPTMLMPVTWTADGWPKIPEGVRPEQTLPKPVGENVGHGMPLSDDFKGKVIGPQWDFLDNGPAADKIVSGGGKLRMQAKGEGPADARQLTFIPANISYDIQVEVEIPDGAEAGMLIWGGNTAFNGTAIRKDEVFMFERTREHRRTKYDGNRVFFKAHCIKHDVNLYYSPDSKMWHKFENGVDVSSGGGRIMLYADGKGEVIFRDFRYQGLD
jgi:xylan 1,4-beta-xylosidase